QGSNVQPPMPTRMLMPLRLALSQVSRNRGALVRAAACLCPRIPVECARNRVRGMERVNERPWEVFHRHWPTLRPPLAVAPDVVRAVAAAIEGRAQRALLLGVTPALAGLADDTTAIDWSEKMVARVWPGDTPA